MRHAAYRGRTCTLRFGLPGGIAHSSSEVTDGSTTGDAGHTPWRRRRGRRIMGAALDDEDRRQDQCRPEVPRDAEALTGQVADDPGDDGLEQIDHPGSLGVDDAL